MNEEAKPIQNEPQTDAKQALVCDTKYVRPKRKYVKKKDKLKGVICHAGNVVVKFD